MNNLITTIAAALVVLVLATVCLGIGKLLSGKNRLRKGCGRQPLDPINSKTCSLCGESQSCETEENDSDAYENSQRDCRKKM